MATNEAALHPEIDGILSRWRTLAQPTLACAGCDERIPTLDAVTLSGSPWCPDCGWAAATSTLSTHLVPTYTPAFTRVSRRDHDEAREVVRMLLARIDARRERGL